MTEIKEGRSSKSLKDGGKDERCYEGKGQHWNRYMKALSQQPFWLCIIRNMTSSVLPPLRLGL